MIHFLQHVDWSIVVIVVCWWTFIIFSEQGKKIIVGTLTFLMTILFGGFLWIIIANPIDKYFKDFIINIHKQKSGDYTIVVKKHWVDFKLRKNMWIKD